MLSLTSVAGMLVALGLCGLWRYHPASVSRGMRIVALGLCPPFMLTSISDLAGESTVALAILIGIIAFANACLYAGVGSGAYFVATLLMRHRKR